MLRENERACVGSMMGEVCGMPADFFEGGTFAKKLCGFYARKWVISQRSKMIAMKYANNYER